MPKQYNTDIIDVENTVKSCVTNAKVSFKNTRETCSTLRGRSLDNATVYLKNVIKKKECVPMRRYSRGCGNTKQAHKFGSKEFPCNKGRWPEKSAKQVLKLIANVKNNAIAKGITPEELIVQMVSVNKAPKIYGRCYRAHGRVNPFNKSPCHIQLVCCKKGEMINSVDEVMEVEE